MQLSAGPAAPQAASPLRAALGAATSTLLATAALAQGTVPATAAPSPSPPAASSPSPPSPPSAPSSPSSPSPAEWKVDSAILFYSESGGRVRAIEPVVSARRTDGNETTLGLKLTLDSLTGASPNGAVPQPAPQTFTSPSGESHYTVAAGAPPLDTSFHDRRAALAATMERTLGAAHKLSLAANVSAEYDFRSIGLSAALARDFNDRNTTLSVGLALEGDRIKPVGGTPVGLRPAFGALAARQSDRTRNVLDVLVGVTRVVDRQWLMQFNLGLGRGSGYHTDPYKMLSVVDGATGLVAGDRYVAEQRPDARTRTSLYWQNKVHLARDVVDVSYRYYRDNWGVRAHTLDARYRFELGALGGGDGVGGGVYIEPRWRTYRQSAADFWRGWLVEGGEWSSATHSAALAAASADPRLAALKADTLGVKAGGPVGRAGEWSVRIESYRQRPDRPADAPGALQSLDLAPTVKATAVLLGYSVAF
ncbi:MAG: DUF3570 domain-containing protein [Rubrivivax sp.]|nr:DUF3570 domain-containing protein [Rubrivivax sp.]